MDREKKLLRIGVLLLTGALALRSLAGTPLVQRLQALTVRDLAAAAVFLETGRMVRVAPEETAPPPQTAPPPGQAQVHTSAQLPLSFSQEDLALLEINNLAGVSIDPETLLRQPVTWDLTREGPTVLILHTHATESYRNTEGYTESASYRTQSAEYNMLSIGREVADILKAGGIEVLHVTTAHDAQSYNQSYSNARQTLEQYLTQYPSIRLVLDLHRDAAESSQGEQIAYTSSLGGQTSAQLMVVAGSDAGGLSNPNWQENFHLAVHLQTALQRRSPGICRPLSLRAQRYNQDMHPGALLIEVGAAGNTRQEALLAAQALAQSILDMAQGTTWTDPSPPAEG